jgi:hypothetical protein
MLFIGTLSTITATYWYTSLDHHAVLWGAFGSFFTLNAEVIGICVNIIALATLAWLGVVRQSLSRKRILVTAGIAGGLIGITANIQTYNFFMGLTVLAAWVCAYGLMRARSTKRTALTIGLLLLAFIIGKPGARSAAQSVVTSPSVATRLNGSRPGALTLTLANKAASGEVIWTSPSLKGSLSWPVRARGKASEASGVLPFPGAWTMRATLVSAKGSVVITSGTATLNP